jgi:hypothetical protein
VCEQEKKHQRGRAEKVFPVYIYRSNFLLVVIPSHTQ